MKTTIKTLKFAALVLLFTGFASCSDDDDSINRLDIETSTVTNFEAPQTGGRDQEPEGGEFAKFDFATGMRTTSDTEWDIAFRGLKIAVNGGAQTGEDDEPERNGNAAAAIVSGTMGSVDDVSSLTFSQDAPGSFAIPTGGSDGWYDYNFTTHTVTPVPGKILVFRTRDGRYAKVEILSYYRDQDTSDPSGSRVYTFNYIYNPNEGDTTFE